jgi:hypothetical protein
MTASTYSKIVKSENFNDNSMSLGFRRWFCLPNATRKNLGLARLIETGETNQHDFMVNFFGSMTEIEYKEWVLTH